MSLSFAKKGSQYRKGWAVKPKAPKPGQLHVPETISKPKAGTQKRELRACS